MNIPCPTKIECECSENPFGNLSAEDPDMLRYLGDNYGWPYYFPSLGSNWSRNSCLGTCYSTISQAEADMCAALNAAICQLDYSGVCVPPNCPDGGTGSGGNDGFGRIAPTVYYSNIQTCTITCADGNVFRYQVRAGMFVASTQELADRMAYSEACRLASTELICIGSLREYACVDQPYIDVLTATSGRPVTFAVVSGSLPTGMALVPYSLYSTRLAGTPTTAGNFTFTVRASNSHGSYMDKVFTLAVVGITTDAALPDATEGIAYSLYLTTSGGTAPYTYAIASGALPTGLTLGTDGLINGNPTASGDFTVTVAATDASDTPITCSKEFTLHVEASTTDLKAWWPFEELVIPPFIDAVGSLQAVVASTSVGTVTQTAGKVGARALLLRPNALSTAEVTVSPSSVNLITSNGFTLTGWFSPANMADPGDTFALSYNIYNGVWVNGGVNPPDLLDCRFVYDPVLGTQVSFNDQFFLPLLPDITPAYVPSGGWDFIVFGYDKTLGQTFVSINNGPLQYSGGAYALALVHTTGRMDWACGRTSAGLVSCGFDETNFYNKALSAAEIADLWNAGAGRTYP